MPKEIEKREIKEIENSNPNPEEIFAEGIVLPTKVVKKVTFEGSKERRKNERRPSRRPERVRQEFDNKIINVRRVTRVIAGGRRFSFSIAMVVGDKNGRVGVGIGKATDTPIAVDKAMRAAKKSITKVVLTDKNSVAHPVEAKYSSAIVSIMPAPGKGIVAGSAVRTVLELAGIKEVSSKILSRSKNNLNIARATIKALSQLKNKYAIS